MNLITNEALLDEILTTEAYLENGTHDSDWIVAAKQLEKQLTEESLSINKDALIRLLSKSITALNKLQKIRNDINFEQITKIRIDDYHCSQGIINALPQKIISQKAREAAQKSHVGTHAKRDEVIAFYQKNICNYLSIEATAKELGKTFDLTHRTLAKYVSFAKKEQKKLRLAGKAHLVQPLVIAELLM